MKNTPDFKLIFPAGQAYNNGKTCREQTKGVFSMTDTSATGNYYTIHHITLFTGLTDRTIRNYINLGILEGEKSNGLWHFTEEQVDAFIRHPAVRPSIQAKQNAIIYDFLLDTKKQEPQVCMILDLPGADEAGTAAFFNDSICNGDFHNLRFFFDAFSGTPRVILKGPADQILTLVNRYYQR